MSGTYTFLPWARQGLANRIATADDDATVKLRAQIEVALRMTAKKLDGSEAQTDITRPTQLYGPGDVIGVDSRAIVRTEPRNFTTNFEPNYLAAIEFYDEDFPWRYTPAAPGAAGARLRPWLTLIVLAEGEFTEGATTSNLTTAGDQRPLPYVAIPSANHAALLPPTADLWAWAHVHVNRGLTASDSEVVANDRAAVATRLSATVTEDADLAYSRIVCPRRLEPNKSYTACLVPTFESGRLAGLYLDPAKAPHATASAWQAYAGREDPDFLPVYHRWTFRTGAIGDFEYLVRLLEPKPVNRRVGVRDIDVQRPAPNLPGVSDPALAGVLTLGGALRVPRKSLNQDELAATERQENWAAPRPHAFQRRLAALINLGDEYAALPAPQANAASGIAAVALDPDPVITPPLYGRWHARTARLLVDRGGAPLPNSDNWVHELNLDPRFRVPAGFGTNVVQAKQEDLMAAAWDQVGDVLEANQRTRRFQLSQQVAFVWHLAHLTPLATENPGMALAATAPVHARVMSQQRTLRAKLNTSRVPPALVSPTMRRLVRPRSPLIRKLPFSAGLQPAQLLERVNRGEVLPAPPKITPPGVVTVGDLADGALPNASSWLIDLLRKYPFVVFVPLLLALLIALVLFLLGTGLPLLLGTLIVGAAVSAWLARLRRSVERADTLREENQTPAAVDALPASPDFMLTAPDSAPANASVTLMVGGTDSAVGVRFKQALRDVGAVVQASARADKVGENGPIRSALDLPAEARLTLTALDPAVTILRRARAVIRIPSRIAGELPEEFVEAMAYPVFNLPMYRPLADLSADLLVPNINLIETNSVTLLETNQKFIEAYMVGLNHEFARELLWREYPTDQRGSCFRQFWDVSSFLASAPDDEALRESLRDIPPLDRWSRASKLGGHDARERPGDNEEEVVLVIRGDLLKRYPNAVIYAQAAEWERLRNGSIDRTKERKLVPLAAGEETNPPRGKLRTPLYEAKIEPDIYFFGFDLTVPVARGGTGENTNDPPGWYFVIKERPGEPRFGFDETSGAQIIVWNDLGWDDVEMAGAFVKPARAAPLAIPNASPPAEAEKEPQRLEDVHVPWDANVSAAELAYILYQAPVMVALHAAEMLPRKV
jgi:hypothetical protein